MENQSVMCKSINWEKLDGQILDSCSWDTLERAWAFQPKTWADPVHYEDERTMLNEAARFFGFLDMFDAMV